MTVRAGDEVSRDLESLAADAGLEVVRDYSSTRRVDGDFGGFAKGQTHAVVRPRDAEQVKRLVAWAVASGTTLTPRGKGFSAGGQAVPFQGVAVDLSLLTRVMAPSGSDAAQIECDAGATWRAVLESSLRMGKIPESLPLNLDMTVGGLLSVGGIGDRVHRTGPIAATVRGLEVVTGRAQITRCDDGHEPVLFDSVRGGLGRFGIATRVSIALRPAPAAVRTFHRLYESADAWLADLLALGRRDDCEHLEGFCWAAARGLHSGPHGTRPYTVWMYGIHAGFALHADRPDREHALRDLEAARDVGIHDANPLEHATRFDPRYQSMWRSGRWSQAHPWLEYFLPVGVAADAISSALARLSPAIGDGHRVLVVRRPRGLPFVPMPDGEHVVCFAILPAGVPALELNDAVASLRAVEELLREAGGRRYLAGWVDTTRALTWGNHFGDEFGRWDAARSTFDPSGVFDSWLFASVPS